MKTLLSAMNRLFWVCPVPSRFKGRKRLDAWANYWIGELKKGPESLGLEGLFWDEEEGGFSIREKAQELPVSDDAKAWEKHFIRPIAETMKARGIGSLLIVQDGTKFCYEMEPETPESAKPIVSP